MRRGWGESVCVCERQRVRVPIEVKQRARHSKDTSGNPHSDRLNSLDMTAVAIDGPLLSVTRSLPPCSLSLSVLIDKEQIA